MYTLGNEFCAKVFGFKTFGKILGIIFLVSSLINLLQYLLNYIVIELNQPYLLVNGVLLIICSISIIFPIYLQVMKH